MRFLCGLCDLNGLCRSHVREFSANSSAMDSQKNIFSSLLSIQTQRKVSLHFVARGEIVPIVVAVATANDHDLPGWFCYQANNWQNCIIDVNPKEASSTIQTFC